MISGSARQAGAHHTYTPAGGMGCSSRSAFFAALSIWYIRDWASKTYKTRRTVARGRDRQVGGITASARMNVDNIMTLLDVEGYRHAAVSPDANVTRHSAPSTWRAATVRHSTPSFLSELPLGILFLAFNAT